MGSLSCVGLFQSIYWLVNSKRTSFKEKKKRSEQNTFENKGKDFLHLCVRSL